MSALRLDKLSANVEIERDQEPNRTTLTVVLTTVWYLYDRVEFVIPNYAYSMRTVDC